MRKMMALLLSLILMLSLSGCSEVEYEKYALSFMQVTNSERYSENKEWLLEHTDESIRTKVDSFLAASNFSNTMTVRIKRSNISKSGNTIKAFYVMNCEAADYGYVAITTFTFVDNRLKDYEIYTVSQQ